LRYPLLSLGWAKERNKGVQTWRRLRLLSLGIALILAGGIRAQSPASKGEITDLFAAYTSCTFSDGLAVVETVPLRKAASFRTVQTVHGLVTIPITARTNVSFTYPGEKDFAEVDVEILPENGYAESKKVLLSNFERDISPGGAVKRNHKLEPTMNGFEIQGWDSDNLRADLPGVYLLFDEKTRTVITIDFLDDRSRRRKYPVLRDRFLNAYTGCIRKRLEQQP
jgi:hypothetical protein